MTGMCIVIHDALMSVRVHVRGRRRFVGVSKSSVIMRVRGALAVVLVDVAMFVVRVGRVSICSCFMMCSW